VTDDGAGRDGPLYVQLILRPSGRGRFLNIGWMLLAIGCGAEPSAEAHDEEAPPAIARHATDDLARFVGEYGTPESERARRTIWVFLHCDGHLVAGATWGSASPWHLDPVSDTDFVQRVPEGVPPVRLEFTIGDADAVEELRVLYDGQPFLPEFPRLRRLRELPAGFEGIECWDRP